MWFRLPRVRREARRPWALLCDADGVKAWCDSRTQHDAPEPRAPDAALVLVPLLIFLEELADFFGEEAADAGVEVGFVAEADEALDGLLVEPFFGLTVLLVLQEAMIDDRLAGEAGKLQVGFGVFDVG